MSETNNSRALTAEEKIAERLDPQRTGALTVSESAGGVAFATVGEVMEFAKLMSLGGVAVPKFLRANPGACIAVCVQAIEWRMSPYAVANKAYSVNDRLAYEAQLIEAVILQRAPIKGRFKGRYEGEGEKRRLTMSVELRDDPGEFVEYTSPEIGKIPVKNSPLWKNDPDQQLWYYSARALCRRHFPDVLLGVYAKDDFEDAPAIGPDRARDVTPRSSTLASQLDQLAGTPAADPETGEIRDEAGEADAGEEVEQTAADDGAPSGGAPADDADDFPGDRPSTQEPEETSETKLARDEGADHRKRGRSRKLVPSKYSERPDLQAAWLKGWDGAEGVK